MLVDLHKTDALLQVTGLQYGHEEAKGIYYAQVLANHGITQAQFDSSLVWYTAHPQLFDKIYPKVLAQLQSEEAAFIAMHDADLQLQPQFGSGIQSLSDTPQSPVMPPFTIRQLDSVLWVTRHGHLHSWNPYAPDGGSVHDTIDEFFPQIGVFR